MNINEAEILLHKWVSSPSLLLHCYIVSRVMYCAAKRYGGPEADPQIWSIAGLLHDADWESFPDDHPQRIVEYLTKQGEEEISHAISAHCTSWNVAYKSQLDRALVASDELCGFIVAYSLMRPDGVNSITPRDVIKKLKNKSFAAAVDRGEIERGCRILGVELEDHITFILESLQSFGGVSRIAADLAEQARLATQADIGRKHEIGGGYSADMP